MSADRVHGRQRRRHEYPDGAQTREWNFTRLGRARRLETGKTTRTLHSEIRAVGTPCLPPTKWPAVEERASALRIARAHRAAVTRADRNRTQPLKHALRTGGGPPWSSARSQIRRRGFAPDSGVACSARAFPTGLTWPQLVPPRVVATAGSKSRLLVRSVAHGHASGVNSGNTSRRTPRLRAWRSHAVPVVAVNKTRTAAYLAAAAAGVVAL
ncbi:hypothetical protein MRX96_031159 [Rhipicephalus microplus]